MATSVFHTAVLGDQFIIRGPLSQVISTLHSRSLSGEPGLLIFSESDGRQVDFDLRGSVEDILNRLPESSPARSVGRPKLGVTSREVTLLPKHWSWLETQRGGASGVLRTLVEKAMQEIPSSVPASEIDAIYHILSAWAGNQPGFEEATRALYKQDWEAFNKLASGWPEEMGTYFKMRISEARNFAPAN